MIVSDDFYFNGLFKIKIDSGFLSERCLDKDSYYNNIRKSIYLSRNGLAKLLCSTLEINEEYLESPDVCIDPDDDKVLIDYLSEVYLSKAELEILNKDTGLLTKSKKPTFNNDKIISSHQTIIKGLLLVIDKLHDKKRVFSSPQEKISANELSKEILNVIAENPSDFLYEKIGDSTIRKYLRKILKEMADNS